ncbi:leucine-rich repeat receptor-like protein [Vigna angularis]|uniref:Leucine-rich repeat receptor-like protein n=1 Tax=Phaseolus angularis TaxID=3914 RepID=A0A8T0K294_PHAAN|nr:leucine-rich repeat receptor-like protein [Vigna angularis]
MGTKNLTSNKHFQNGVRNVGDAHFLRLFFLLWFIVVAVFGEERWDGVVVTQSNFLALEAFKQELVDPEGFLRSWNDSGYGACSGGWVGIKCAQGQVIVIQLPWKGLKGRITERIGQLQGLRKLSLHDNQIGGLIPSSLGVLLNLRGVQLFNNRFTGSLPPSLGSCPLLQSLDLSNNLLSGTIPISLGNATKLYWLNLSFNSFSGPIPTTLTRLTSLTYISLQHNNLSGSIPNSWGGSFRNHVFRLQNLILDYNFFSGTIPASLGNLSELTEISLSHNQLRGPIPNEIGSLYRLKTVDFSSNALNGSLPATLSNVSSLTLLNVENNHLGNQIPEALGRLHNLSVLVLSRNQFSGHIPQSIGNMSKLTQLDLSMNNLSGEIPASFEDLSGLNFFNVSHNNLSGPVPALLGHKFNSSSFVGNIQLCGYSPSTPCPSPAPFGSPKEKSENHRHKKLGTKDIILIVAGVLLVVLVTLCCILLFCLIRKRTASNAEGGQATGRASASAATTEKRVPPVAGEAEAGGGEAGGKLVHFDGPLAFTADDLLCATAEIMGKSTYGTVYKATLEDGSQAAVKRLREKITKGQKEFESEVSIIGRIRHPNLLALRAYYLGPKGEKLLVFDYMPKGSLASFLHARGPETAIDWPTRMKIAQGMAQLLTGKPPGEALNGVDLPQWVASIVKEEWTNEVFDVELMRDASTYGDEMLNTLKLALHCVDPSPSARPEVQQVLQQLEEIRPEISASSGDDGAIPSTSE